jgi:hypothetical protein
VVRETFLVADVVTVVESAPHLAEDRMALRGAYGVLREDVVEDDSGAASPEALAPPSVAVVSSRMLGKHVGQVLNYLALLAWNRCVMSLVGGPTRTTIDVLMTRQFHGIALVWTWAYALGVSSACVAVVRWSAEKRASLEEEETERRAHGLATRTAEERTRDGEDVRLDAGRCLAALRALRRSPLGSPFRFTRRFRAFAHARLQGACTYVAMWALAVASLGTLPARTAGQDFLAAALLSAVFAAVAALGAKGRGPLGGVLGVTTERDVHARGEGIAAEDAARLARENDTSRVARLSVRVTCEWIVAVAWVGAARRLTFGAFGLADEHETARHSATRSVASVPTQLVDWLVALLAVGARAAYVAARAAGRDEPWAEEFARDAAEAAAAAKAALAGASPSGDATTSTNVCTDVVTNETPLLVPEDVPSESLSEDAVALKKKSARREKIRETILDSASVAADASSVLAGAFAFTAGVALNAAAQTTWPSVVRGMDASASATAYALALSAVTVAAATYAARSTSDADDGIAAAATEDAGRDAAAANVDERATRRAVKRRRRRIVARELAADEERVGAFIAGFAWNAAFSALVGDDGVAGWPWIAAAGWTAAAAGYAAVEESVREVKAALEETEDDDERRVNAGGL